MPRPNIDRLYARAEKAQGSPPTLEIYRGKGAGFYSDGSQYKTATDAICAALWRIIIEHRPANARKAKLPRVLRQTKTR